jgi:hypothetical protein
MPDISPAGTTFSSWSMARSQVEAAAPATLRLLHRAINPHPPHHRTNPGSLPNIAFDVGR